jgi:hypothetical protein
MEHGLRVSSCFTFIISSCVMVPLPSVSIELNRSRISAWFSGTTTAVSKADLCKCFQVLSGLVAGVYIQPHQELAVCHEVVGNRTQRHLLEAAISAKTLHSKSKAMLRFGI